MASLSIFIRVLALALVALSQAVKAQEGCVENSVVFSSRDPTPSALLVHVSRKINSCVQRHAWSAYGPHNTTLTSPYHVSAFAAEEKSDIVVQLTYNNSQNQLISMAPMTFKINPDAYRFHVYCTYNHGRFSCVTITKYRPGVKKCIPTCVTYIGHEQKLNIKGHQMNDQCGDFGRTEYNLLPTRSIVCFFIKEDTTFNVQLKLWGELIPGLPAGTTVFIEAIAAHADKGLMNVTCIEKGRRFVCHRQFDHTDNDGMVWYSRLPLTRVNISNTTPCATVHVTFQIEANYQGYEQNIFQVDFDRVTPNLCSTQNVTSHVAFSTTTNGQAWFNVVPGALMKARLVESTYDVFCGEFYVDPFESMNFLCTESYIGCQCIQQ